MLGYSVSLHLLGLALVLHLALSLDAHSGTGSIKARDTDEVSSLKGKLTRLINLLSSIEDGEESDLMKVARNKAEATTPKPAVSAEEMGHGQHNKVEQTPSRAPVSEVPEKSAGVKPHKSLVSPQDSSSIEILAKALSRLPDPTFDKGDSTGDYLGTDYNGSRLDDEKTREMEAMLERALSRLGQDGSDDRSNKPAANDDLSLLDVLQKPKGQSQQLREQVMRAAEVRLVDTVLLADKLGISVDDLIQDIDTKAGNDQKLEEFEKDLEALNSQNKRTW